MSTRVAIIYHTPWFGSPITQWILPEPLRLLLLRFRVAGLVAAKNQKVRGLCPTLRINSFSFFWRRICSRWRSGGGLEDLQGGRKAGNLDKPEWSSWSC